MTNRKVGRPGAGNEYSQDDYMSAYATYGSIRKAAAALGVTHRAVELALKHAGQQPSKVEFVGGLGGQTKTIKRAVPKKGVKRYIITAAQTETKINEGFWNNLLALADYYSAEILVSPFVYNKQFLGNDKSGKKVAGKSDNELFADMDPALASYLTTDRIQLAKGLVFCGEVQILPTAVDPLSGMEAYTGRASGIFPHAKIEMRSVPSMRDEPTKFNYTTGCVTRHNYIQKKAGQKGEFHHAYGALIVEVMKDGWWVRQLNADKNNHIWDMDVYAYRDSDGRSLICVGGYAEAVVTGDTHIVIADPDVIEATWGKGGLMELLEPRIQVLHDVYDARARPWQDTNSFHRTMEKHYRGWDSIEDENRETAGFINSVEAAADETVIAWSNHHDKLDRMLDDKRVSYHDDPVNAEWMLEAQLEMVRAIKRNDDKFILLKWALEKVGLKKFPRFLKEDESFIICPDAGGGIECGMHGHRGPNGAKGTPKALQKMARKIVIGDKHTAGIYGGVYVVGTCAPAANTAFAKGPSSWSPTHCVIYPNGKRALVTMWNKRFFAPRDDL